MFFYIVLTPISITSGLRNTGNTRKCHQIDVYIYQCLLMKRATSVIDNCIRLNKIRVKSKMSRNEKGTRPKAYSAKKMVRRSPLCRTGDDGLAELNQQRYRYGTPEPIRQQNGSKKLTTTKLGVLLFRVDQQ